MITLLQRDCFEDLTGTLAAVASRFAPLAAGYVSGNGPWDSMLPRTPNQSAHHTYRLQGGRIEFAAPVDLGALPTRMLFDIKLATTKIYQHHNWFLGRNTTAPCAVVLRPAAYVFLSGLDHGNFYVQLPGITAHDVLGDPAQLEAEFPGQFRIEA